MFIPKEIDLIIYQGATFRKAWDIVDKQSGSPVDLTGYTARMHIRGKIKDELPVVVLTTTNGGISIMITESQTVLSLFISAEVTAALTISKGVYDLEIVDTSGEVYRLVQGQVTISKEVTR